MEETPAISPLWASEFRWESSYVRIPRKTSLALLSHSSLHLVHLANSYSSFKTQL